METMLRRTTLAVLVILVLAMAGCRAGPRQEDDSTSNATPEPTRTSSPVPENLPPALPDLQGQEITIAVENAYLPFNFILLGEDAPQGWDYDVIGEICRRLNCAPVWVEMRWEFIMGSVAEGSVDMAGEGITITVERAEQVAFSDPYLTLFERLLVRSEEHRFETVEAFVADDSLRLGGEMDTFNLSTAIDLVGEERVEIYETFEEAVDALVAEEIDGIVYDEVSGLGYLGYRQQRLRFTGDPISTTGLGFVFQKGSDLIPSFNLAISSLMEDGFLREANLKWFDPDLDLTYEDVELGAYGSPTQEP